MKTLLRVAALFLVTICAVFLAYAQEAVPKTVARAKDAKLPPLLQPSDYAVQRANEMGGEVFKLVPVESSYELNPIWTAWGKGPYYAFSERSHRPSTYEIGLVHGSLRVGGGMDYGFFLDLGKRDFRDVDRTLPEADYLFSYKPPKLRSEVISEIYRVNEATARGLPFPRRVPVNLGHTYLLRSITFGLGSGDAVFLLHVVERSPDGSVTIIWRNLVEFERPLLLFMSNAELQKQLDGVLAELDVSDLRVIVQDNVLRFMGRAKDFQRVRVALSERRIPYRAI